MKYLKLLSLSFAISFSFAACSSSTTETGRNTAVTNSNSAGPISNSLPPPATIQNTNVNSNSNTGPPLKSTDMRSRANSNGVMANVSGTPVPPQFQPAAENSEWAVTMNGDGSVTEIRIFRSHPQLARTEVFSRDGRNKIVKIILRNGKTVDVKTDRPFNLMTASSSEILQIGGIQSANPPSK
ncbi:MAG: hypothetical protein ABJB40_11865 [Acidobacteriota bacterium]